MEWLARSADIARQQDVQSYARHVIGVYEYAKRYLRLLAPLLPPTILEGLKTALLPAVTFHDLGKLDDDNQAVLRGEKKSHTLPIVHSDAGVAKLLCDERVQSALLVASHHTGLLNLVEEINRGDDFFRISEPSKRMREPLELLLKRHSEALQGITGLTHDVLAEVTPQNLTVFLRMALSCLVDADHTDSAMPNRPIDDIKQEIPLPLLPERRLEALDTYISHFTQKSERDNLRSFIYKACRDQVLDEKIVACDNPVGSGKTTAVMAHLLKIASIRGLQRIFVVLPFTNIIRQSADVYRKALILPGENPNDIVVEVHHLADFTDEASRELAIRWSAPIVVTTAVAFFETLASAHPSSLRRLHELAGAAVFVDEAHAALPAKLLPVAWRWIQALADEWNVHWVLASGSLVHFWEMKEVLNSSGSSTLRTVPFLATNVLRKQAVEYEQSRVIFKSLDGLLAIDNLLEYVTQTPGPRLVILNTVQNAAVVARAFERSGQFSAVFHLSTALTPADREVMLETVKKHLTEDTNGNWILVGTSCIEAGMDLDFATGFREMSSLTSLIQSSGRVNRSGKRKGATMFSFRLREEDGIISNKGMEDSIRVLRELLAMGCPVSSDLCTEALRRELLLDPHSESLLAQICQSENECNFPKVEKLFKIINADTRTVVIGNELVQKIESFESVDWREIQRNSVQIWGYRIEKLHIPELNRHPGVFKWHLNYSSFLGYMEGVLEQEEYARNGGGIL